MTLSQDQTSQQDRHGTGAHTVGGQPQSRRAARESERQAAAATEDSGAGQHPSGIYDLNASGNIWDTISRRAASQLTDAAGESDGRGSRRGEDDNSSEPFSFVAPARPTVPTYDGASLHNDGSKSAEAVGGGSRSTVAVEQQDVRDSPAPSYRVRDYAPRRSSGQAPSWQDSFAPRAADGELDYHTETRTPPLRTTASESASGSAGATRARTPALPLEHTLTRRELRAMQGRAAVAPASAAAPAPTEATAAPTGAAPTGAAPTGAAPTGAAPAPAVDAGNLYEDLSTVQMSAIERAALWAEGPAAVISEPLIAVPVPAEAPSGSAPLSAEPVETVVAEVVEPTQTAAAEAVPAGEPAPVQNDLADSIDAHDTKPRASAPSITTGLHGFEAIIAQANASREFSRVAAPQPQAQRAASDDARIERPLTPPVGHWSVQSDEDDLAMPFAGLLSRNVGSGGGSSNALIMPSDPQPSLIQALNSTGEIMVTGSMDLPRSLSSTGAPSGNFDSTEIDRLFEASQDDSASDVVPVRASRAVSGHTSAHNVVNRPRRSTGGGMLPTALAITAAVMAVGVIGLLIGGYVLHIF